MIRTTLKEITVDLEKANINTLYTQVISNINIELSEFKSRDYDTKRLRTLTILLRTLKTIKSDKRKVRNATV